MDFVSNRKFASAGSIVGLSGYVFDRILAVSIDSLKWPIVTIYSLSITKNFAYWTTEKEQILVENIQEPRSYKSYIHI